MTTTSLPPERGASPRAGAAGAPTSSTHEHAKGTGGAYRPEIQGLRAIAVLLVAVYHIWFGTVSGGVDVFLLLTGFLITGSLLRSVERRGRIGFPAFWARLARRLLPTMAVVLVGVMVATFLWLPAARWRGVLREVVASVLYHENWVLALNSVDYLADNDSASPLQHIWSLSVQGQFYVIAPVLVTLAAFIAARAGRDPRRVLLFVLGGVFALSLAYSVYMTEANQPWAYFDSGARLWELALGGLFALVLPYLNLPLRLRVLLGWTGLAALALCGALVPVSTMFPGYVALWPTGAAIMVILAGTTGSKWGADRWLVSRPLSVLADLSYSLYLWHWPVLVFYLQVTERNMPSLKGGCYVLVTSLILAWITNKLVGDRVEGLSRTKPGTRRDWGIAAAFLVPVLVASSLWYTDLTVEQRRLEALAADPANYPGAAVVANPELAENLPEAPVYPDPAGRADVPSIYPDGCDARLSGKHAIVCEYGDETSEHTIALVGASRTAHWFPPMLDIVEKHGWHLVNITKSGCQFATETPMRDGEVFTECIQWREEAMVELERIRPDVVVTSSTRATGGGERVHDGFIERWEQLREMGTDVIGIRDLPRRSERIPECLTEKSREECVESAYRTQAEVDPTQKLDYVPDNVTFVDLTEYVCPGGECPAVLGNVMVYSDATHMTQTFSRTLTPMLEAAVLEATGW
ncbi:acyltransferase family protein [Nocardiopsis sp. FIRDI 009]|uniref:acyltransferase family protein n=1 Tax=Nocardiopsis sp. FIRDI 009 TaxID=714197 RepID=UPI000E26FA52|nr:acyltransferase family protein [Nocardiopsis sp. FIRDI 009]